MNDFYNAMRAPMSLTNRPRAPVYRFRRSTRLAIWWLLLMCAFALGCENESDSRRALESAGFTEIQITGWEPLRCSDSDDFSTGFVAKNPSGVQTKGVVCCGWLKGCTVRF